MAPPRPVVLLTGSSGRIGSALGERLRDEYTVVGLDRPGCPLPPSGVEPIDADLTSDGSLGDALIRVRKQYGPDVASVVHLADHVDFSGAPSPLYEAVTVGGTARLLRGLRDFRVGQVVFASTMFVHAPCPPGARITEDTPLAPAWDYPAAKARAEEIVRGERGAAKAVILRLAGVYDGWCHSAPLAQQVRRVWERRLGGRLVPGHLDRGQSFVHRDDAAEAFAHCLEGRDDLPAEAVFLIGEPDPVGSGELHQRLARLLHGEEWRGRRVPKLLAKAGAWVGHRLPFGPAPAVVPQMIDRADEHYALDINRARTLLGWDPKHALRRELPALVRKLKADPARWYLENGLEPPPRELAA